MRAMLCEFVALSIVMAVLPSAAQKVEPNRAGEPRNTPGGAAIAFVPEVETIPRSPERLARGQYLVEGLLQCTMCHSQMDFAHRRWRTRVWSGAPARRYANCGAEHHTGPGIWRRQVERR